MNYNYITLNDSSYKNNTLAFFRREMENENGGSINIKIHASSSYQLYIDGELIGRGNAPGDNSRVLLDEYNVNTNAIFCVLVKVYSLGESIQHVPQQNKGVLALNMEITDANNTVYTNSNFKCILAPDYFRDELIDTQGKRISLWGGYKEVYDDSLSLDGYMLKGYDDSLWLNAEILANQKNIFKTIITRSIKPLVEYDYNDYNILQTNNNLGKITINTDGTIFFDTSVAGSFPTVIFDFKKEVVGYLTVIASAEVGSNFTVSYGECLDLVRLDSFIFGNKKGILQPYSRRAFRYIAITFNGAAKGGMLESLTFKMTHYPVNLPKISFDNELYQKVFNTSIYTATLAMQHHYEDSIYREQALWLLDARIMAQINYLYFKEYDYTTEIINKFILTQRVDGSICAAGPQATDQLLPDFCLHFIIMVQEWISLGKGELDDSILQCLKKLLNWFSENENANGLLTIKNKSNFWCFIDWADIDKRDVVTALNCLYYQALIAYSKIIYNNVYECLSIVSKANALKNTINDKLLRSDGTYCDCAENEIKSKKSSQQTNVYAIISGVCQHSQKLIKTIFDSNYKQTKVNGAFMMCLTVDMLFEENNSELAKQLINSYWGEMLRRGATSWWETFDVSTSSASVPYYLSKNNATYKHEYIPVSYCHAWGAGIATTLIKYQKELNNSDQ